MAFFVDDFAAEAWVGREGGRSKTGQSRCDRNRTGEVVTGDVESSESGLIERRDGSVEPIPAETEVVEPVELG